MTRFPVKRSEMNGVAVFSSELPLTFTGALAFAVGVRDETARTAGLAHLVEHLVMHLVGRVDVEHNAVTAEDSVTFYAQGRQADVLDFLERVCRAVEAFDTITDADVEHQRALISAELGEGDEQPGSGPLIDRFGADDLGLLDFGQPAHRTHTRVMAVEFVRSWFVRENAAFVFSRTPDRGIDAALPERGAPIARSIHEPIRGNGWVPNPSVQLAVSLILDAPRAERIVAGTLIAERLHERLRTERGLAYSVIDAPFNLDRRRRHALYILDPRDDDLEAAAVETMEVLRALAADGPRDEEVHRLTSQFGELLANPEWVRDVIPGVAVAFLRGEIVSDEELLVEVDHIRASELRAVLARSLDTVLLSIGVPAISEETAERLGLDALLDDTTFAGASRLDLVKQFSSPSALVLSAKFRSGLGRAQLVVDDPRVAVLESDGVTEVAWNDLITAGRCRACGHWELAGSRGNRLYVDPGHWRGAAKALSRIEARVPAFLRYDVSGDVHRGS